MRAMQYLQGVCVLAALLAGNATAGVPANVSVQYKLVTAFAGAERAGGKIIVAVTNHSALPLANITLRLADPSLGRITGPVQEDLVLAAGETRKVEGQFVLNATLVGSAQPLDWIVVYSDEQGFAQQLIVRGEALTGASIDSAAKVTN